MIMSERIESQIAVFGFWPDLRRKGRIIVTTGAPSNRLRPPKFVLYRVNNNAAQCAGSATFI